MDNKTGLECFDHIVVLMLENRSFDNILGYLYEDGVPHDKSFEGLQDGPISVPVPARACDHSQHPTVATATATNFHQPYPDPGEVYQHVNTQLFDTLDKDNIGVDAAQMKPPYNLPDSVPHKAPMSGFVNDYINTLQALGGDKYKTPHYDQYKGIMACYSPKHVSVLATLAKEFAVFDHWFCSVPSQTWCNRAFWHAGTSCGEVVNPPGAEDVEEKYEAFKRWEKKFVKTPNLFGRMNAKRVRWTIYQEQGISLTRFVNGFCNPAFYDKNFKNGLVDFQNDIKNEKLPHYCFIEPRFLLQHNDQHPSSYDSSLFGETQPGSVLLGEKLIWDIYQAIRNSDTYRDNTLLIITHDEHGGCFDHVPPPPACPPKPGMVGDKGFKFDRLGVRVPMVMVSAYIQPNTIVNEEHDHTSFIKTCSEKWKLKGLTDRDKNAKSFADILGGPRREFPQIPEPDIQEILLSMEEHRQVPLNELQKNMLAAMSFHGNNKAGQLSALKTAEGYANFGDAQQLFEAFSSRSIYCRATLRSFLARIGYALSILWMIFKHWLEKLLK